VLYLIYNAIKTIQIICFRHLNHVSEHDMSIFINQLIELVSFVISFIVNLSVQTIIINSYKLNRFMKMDY
jgi:hypothetical protein